MKDTQYGVINEVGDMGLGFTQVTKKEQKILEQQKEQPKKDDKENS